MDDEFLANADDLLVRNREGVASLDRADLQVAPKRRLAIVSCMDSRMDTFAILGLARGDAHIIRNAGGVITDDVVRSLCLSQRFMGTREIILMHHTDCGLQQVSEDEFKADLEAEIGIKPWWALESFGDPAADVRQSIERLRVSPFITYKDNIRGFVYNVKTGLLDEAA